MRGVKHGCAPADTKTAVYARAYYQRKRKEILDQRQKLKVIKLNIPADSKGPCGICGEDKPLVIDHDHKTERFRGRLCRQCNLALGGFKDNKEIVRKALEYLEKANAKF